MKLSDALRRKEDGDPLDERIAAEMEALDAALRGEPVEPEMSSLATLATDLRADREEIDPEFSASLDAWAAAGFPRGERPGSRESSSPTASASAGLARLRERISSTPPRRLLAPAFAAASVVVIVAVAIGQSGEIAGNDSGDSGTQTIIDQEPTAIPEGELGETTPSVSGDSASSSGGGAAGAATPDAGQLDGGAQGVAPAADAPADAERDAGADYTHRAPSDALKSATSARGEDLDRAQRNRKVERDAQLSLAADPDDVSGVASQATDVTEGYGGHVLSSRVSGSTESATATMELAIPSKNLDAAISDLSDLADVSSSSQGSDDITRPFVTARDELSGFRAQRDSVLKRLSEATTDQETADLNAKLAVLNDQIASARASVENLQNRASISHVSLRISSEEMIGSSDDDEGGWSIGDAVDDAGHVLTVVAGVALISAAILLPLAILALIAGLALRASRSKARERTLDD